jgi:hypothetical protein
LAWIALIFWFMLRIQLSVGPNFLDTVLTKYRVNHAAPVISKTCFYVILKDDMYLYGIGERTQMKNGVSWLLKPQIQDRGSGTVKFLAK